MLKITLNITGMTCAACSSRVEKAALNVKGASNVSVNLLTGKLTADVSDESVSQRLIQAVISAGYGVAENQKREMKTALPETENMKMRIVCSFLFLFVLMYFTMGHMIGLPIPKWYHGVENALVAALLQLFLTLPVVYLNRKYYKNGIRSLVKGAANMDTLIAVGSGAALLYGVFALFAMAFGLGRQDFETVKKYSENLYFESVAMILTLVTLGKFLELKAKRKTGDAVQKLMALNPDHAVVLRDGVEITIPADELSVGDIVVVRSGDRISVDGIVLSGRASVDESALTGESMPKEMQTGDKVATATICIEGYMQIRAEKIGEDTTLSQIIRIVEESGGTKAPIARMADKIAGIFVPAVMAIAAITFVVWVIVGESLAFALTNGISVLVISCPCALGLATPVAIMVAMGKGAQMGILFKNAESLENLNKIDTVVLDKTGTLTLGKPAVTDVIPVETDENELLKIAKSLESKSEHLFAKAIMAYGNELVANGAEDFLTIPGMGVSGLVDGVRYYGGNRVLMEQKNISVPTYPELESEGKTILYFASEDGAYLGAIAAADVLKPDSAEAVGQLRKIGKSVVMLTGDNDATARSIADKAGIDCVIANVLPADKASAIAALQSEGKNVLMVGDGINDAPALVTANVGAAIGSGTDIAMESAEVVLMQDSLTGISNAISLSETTVRNIRQNLFWAFFYNVLGIPIAAGVLYPIIGLQLSPMIAAAAMSMSSVFVVTNALRLRFFKGKKQEAITVQEDKTMEKIIKVDGMMCPHCQARVESVSKAVPGVTQAVVDLKEKQVTLQGNFDLSAVKKAITDAGYTVIEE